MTETVISDEGGHWAESLVGDNEERLEAMKAYDDPTAFFDAHDALANKDFRKDIAGDDDKFLSVLQRYNTPADLGNAFREQKQMISANKIQQPLGEDATDEDVAAFRESNGIPAEAKGYFDNLPEGLILGDEDKEYFEDFAGVLHGKNVAPELMHDIIGWYNGLAEREQDATAELDNAQSTEANDQLRADWGSDYRANINLVSGLIESTFGKEAKDQIMSGRYPDGRAFLNDPNVLKGFADLARKMNPVMEMGGDHHTAQQSLNDEIAEIEKFMSTNRTEYLKDEPKQARLRSLYELRIKQAAA